MVLRTGGGDLYSVRVDDPHHVVRVERFGDAGPVRLSDFDEDLGVAPPPDADVLDLGWVSP